jgi:hypothetical protein
MTTKHQRALRAQKRAAKEIIGSKDQPKSLEFWDKPYKVQDLDLAFGGDMKVLLPPYSLIPEEFKSSYGTPWNKMVSKWFFSGLDKDTEVEPQPGIDPGVAMRHIKAVLGSWEPKHEHKEAGVAYLLSKWFIQFGDAKHEG